MEKKRPPHQNMEGWFGGLSNPGGFEIESFWGKKFTTPGPDYSNHSIFEKWAWVGVVIWGAIIGLIIFFLFLFPSSNILVSLLFLWAAVTITAIIIGVLDIIRMCQWHALEHKVIFLLERNENISIRSLKEARVKNKYCGDKNLFLLPPSQWQLEIGREIGIKIQREMREKI